MKSDGVQSRIDVRSGGGGNMCFGFHEGARSEILAQYLFSAFGAVSRVLQHEDYGIDLYCSLAEKVSSAWLVRDVYFVQVKSESVPSWLLSGDSVLWISRHPVPVFLASVDKDQQTIEVYHTLPRFVGAISKLQTLELIPEPQLTKGGPTDWNAGGRQSLSAPILKVKLEDLKDRALRAKLGHVLKRWIEEDSFNCLMQRTGINRVRKVHDYTPNEVPKKEQFEEVGLQGFHTEDDKTKTPTWLVEALDNIGAQFAYEGDRDS